MGAHPGRWHGHRAAREVVPPRGGLILAAVVMIGCGRGAVNGGANARRALSPWKKALLPSSPPSGGRYFMLRIEFIAIS